MIATFQKKGETAKAAKRPSLLRIPTTIPVIPSRIRIGKRICARVTVRSRSSPSKPGAKIGTSSGAARTKIAVIAPRTIVTRKISWEASLNASRRSPCSSFSTKTGTKAAWIAASANRLRTRFGTWKAIVKADIGPLIPK